MTIPATTTLRIERPSVGVVLCCLALAIAAAAAHSENADAGTWTLVSCTQPDGQPAPTDGWTSTSTGAVGPYSGDVNSCAEGGSLAALSSAQAPQSAYGGPQWQFTAPAGSTIAGGTLTVTLTSPHGQAWIGAPEATYDTADVLASCQYNLACGATGRLTGVFPITHTGARNIYATAVCVGAYEGAGTCPAAGGLDAAVYVKAAIIELSNASNPAGSGFTGGLLAAGARGTQDVTFTATDPAGPGVYSITALLDGETVYSGTPDVNSGSCVAAGTNAGTLMFTSGQPCRASETVSLPIDTTALKDGTHTLKLAVQDAAKNTSTVYDASISTANAPANTAAPTITGSGDIGGTLTAHPGEWSAPAGAGTVSYGYQWQACDGQGNGCSAIAGATSAAYAPTAADIGHALRAAITAGDQDGTTILATAPTGVIGQTPSGALLAALGAANGSGASQGAELPLDGPKAISRTFTRRAVTLEGQLVNSAGAPIAGALLDVLAQPAGSSTSNVVATVRSTPSGHVAVRVPGGPSRAITIAYRAFSGEPGYSAQATVKESVQAGVQMHITPRRTSPAGSIAITGTVSGPMPRRGVVVTLLVHYRGQWQPFRDPHTDANGHFHVRYHFQGAIGSFPFRAEVLGEQAGLPYATGDSPSISVRTG